MSWLQCYNYKEDAPDVVLIKQLFGLIHNNINKIIMSWLTCSNYSEDTPDVDMINKHNCRAGNVDTKDLYWS